MTQCICQFPQIIINPLAAELIAQHANYSIRGKQYRLTKCKNLLYDFKTKNINPHSLNIKSVDIDSCFIVDSRTKEHYPLYLEVPCGHCDVCKQSKVNAFVHRCKLETQMYNSQPFFITLTYDENHKKECGVCLRDVQLFFKRLRINLVRKGYRKKIRYALCAEYGRRTHRPHYHCILWNLHQSDILSYIEIRDLIKKSWSNGFCMQRLIDPSNDKGFYYTGKYLRKDNYVPRGCNKAFLVCSNRGGSIGSRFIDRHAGEIRRSLDTKYKFVNKWNSKVEPLQYNRYILNRLFPSFSKSLPLKVKRSARQFVLNYNILKNRNNENYKMFKETYENTFNFFGKFFYLPVLANSEIKASMEDTDKRILGAMLREETILVRAFNKGFEYYRQQYAVGQCRQKFLEKLFMYQQQVDVRNKGYNARRAAALAAEREIF